MSALPEDLVQRMPQRYTLAPNLALWIILATVVCVFWQTLAALARVWRESADYQHGFLVALVSIGLLFKSRSRIAAAPVHPKPAMLPLLALTLLCWAIAYRANSEMLQQIAFPVTAMLSIICAMGPAAARITVFPILFLYFAIPVWDQLTPLLQALSTATSESVLGVLGVPTQVEGFNVTIPAGRFSIVEGCSGKRYLIISLALGTLVGVLQNVGGRRLIALVALSGACALVTNWVRIIIIIYAGHVSDMQHYLVAVEHLSLGYALYIPLLGSIVWLGRRLGTDSQPLAPSQPIDVSARSLISGVAGPIALLLLAATLLLSTQSSSDAQAALSAPPLLTSTWQGPFPPQSDWTPVYRGANDELRASYRSGPHRIEIYANTYGVQSQGAELVQFGNSVVPSDAWTVVRPIDIAAPLDARIASTGSNSRWVIAHTYFVAGRQAVSPGKVQLMYGWSALWRPAPSGLVALAVACNENCDAAAHALTAFWSENSASLTAMIPEQL